MGATPHHDLLIYDSDEEYGKQAAAYFDAGLDTGEALLAVPARTTEPLLRDALGATAQRVTFHTCEDWYTRPEAAVAGYDATVRACLQKGATGVRVVAEVPFCSTLEDWDSWVRYEAIINRVLADRPVSILCTYDSRVVPENVLDGMRHAHPHLMSDGCHVNSDYQDPADVVRMVAREPEPLPELYDLPVDGDALALREALARELANAAVAPDRAEAMILAVSEVVVNAERHGGGVRRLSIGGTGAMFVCEVEDAGRGLDDPLAGYVPPAAPAGNGAGLWVARQLTRRLDLVPAPQGGLTARLWA
jgi:anti-sigma regulatory factor (Ser/Thr protein kinase)